MAKTKKRSSLGGAILWILILCGVFYALGRFFGKESNTPSRAVVIPTAVITALPATDVPMPTNTPTPIDTPTATLTSTLTPIPTIEEIKTPIPYVIAGAGDTNLYKGPGNKYEQVGILTMGQTADIVARTGDSSWFKIAIQDGFAWVAVGSVIASHISDNIPIDDSLPMSTQEALPPTCDCSGDLYNCDDFNTPFDAQRCYKSCPGDPHGLDRDGDGNACEWQPE